MTYLDGSYAFFYIWRWTMDFDNGKKKIPSMKLPKQITSVSLVISCDSSCYHFYFHFFFVVVVVARFYIHHFIDSSIWIAIHFRFQKCLILFMLDFVYLVFGHRISAIIKFIYPVANSINMWWLQFRRAKANCFELVYVLQ